MPVTWRAYIDNRTAQMEEEIRALKRKSKIGEIGLKATEERCRSLERNVRLVQISLTIKLKLPIGQRRVFSARSIIYRFNVPLPWKEYNWVCRQPKSGASGSVVTWVTGFLKLAIRSSFCFAFSNAQIAIIFLNLQSSDIINWLNF